MSVVSLQRTYKTGATWRFEILRTDESGTPIDLTGQTVTSTFSSGAGGVSVTLDALDGVEVVPLDGKVILTVSDDRSETLTSTERCSFDVRMEDTEGNVWISPTYRFVTEPQVTQRGG